MGEKEKEVVNRIIRWWRLFKLLKQMPFNIVNDPQGLQRIILSEPSGSLVEVLLCAGQIVSWKTEHGEELLYTRTKVTDKSLPQILGGIFICFPQASEFGQHEYARNGLWSLDNNPLDETLSGSRSSVNLIFKSLEKDLNTWPCRFELRLTISLSRRKLSIMPSVRNTGDKTFSFTMALRNSLLVSDISEVRVEGLETLEYVDNVLHKKRFTEQVEALTFDGEVDRMYLNTKQNIAIVDHGKKRTFVLCKQGFADAVVRNPGIKPTRTVSCAGDDYKTMVSVDSAAFERPVVLKPLQEWRGIQEISLVSSSYCSGQLDPQQVLRSVS